MMNNITCFLRIVVFLSFLPCCFFSHGIDRKLVHANPIDVGLNDSLNYRIDSIVCKSLNDGAFPGCQVLVAKEGKIVHDKSYGFLTQGGKEVDESTLYDLASVSKIMGTLPVIMKLYDSGRIDLDNTISDYIPELLGSDKENITVRELLFHESGLPATINWRHVITEDTDGAAVLRNDLISYVKNGDYSIEIDSGLYARPELLDTMLSRIYRIPLRKDRTYNYSCLNFSLLMDIARRITGIPHEVFVRDSIYEPIGMFSTFYRPLEHVGVENIAPTEIDSIYRRQILHGFVHDGLANFSGGVSGNAGLFSTTSDLAKLCQLWLNHGVYDGKRIFSEETVKTFTTVKSPTCRRGLGFDRPDILHPDNSPTCETASPSVYGHLGFTGTAVWIDPENEIIYIFLTNRNNPTRDNPAFAESNIRSSLFNEIYRAIY